MVNEIFGYGREEILEHRVFPSIKHGRRGRTHHRRWGGTIEGQHRRYHRRHQRRSRIVTVTIRMVN